MVPAEPETAGVILLVGMHRSGTSLFSQMCSRAGQHLGGPLLNGRFSDNEQGYWEHMDVVAIQTILLRELGRGPMSKLPLPLHWRFRPEAETARRCLREVIERETAGGRTWLLKDPRTCRLLPLWQELLREMDIPLRVVLCIRSPAEVAASLKRRQNLDEWRACQLWTDHHRDILGAVPVPDAIVDYDETMAHPAEVMRAVFCRLDLEAAQEQITHAALAATPALRHHRRLEMLETETERAFVEAANLYEQLLSHSVLKAPWAMDIHPPDPRPPNPDRVLIVTRLQHSSHFLSQTLRSVLSQTHASWRMVIINDGAPASEVDQAIAPYRAAFGGRLVVHHISQPIEDEAANKLATREGDEDCMVIHSDGDVWEPGLLESILSEREGVRLRASPTHPTPVHEHAEAGQLRIHRMESS